MQQQMHRTLRSLPSITAPVRPRPLAFLSLPGVPAFLLLATLAVLGWRAHNAALFPASDPHVSRIPAASPASSPALPAASVKSAAVVPHAHALPLATAAPSQTLHQGALPPVSPAGDLLRRAMSPNPRYLIMAPPSISVAVIRAELRLHHSPLMSAHWAGGKDAAQYIWDAGYVTGVDPAMLMALFWHESHYGTRGMARLTDSVGNIRPLAGQPELNGYRFYRTWQEGVDDTYRLLIEYAHHGAPDIATALPVWAPPADGNNVATYISDVQAMLTRYYGLSVPSSAAQLATPLGAAMP